MNNEVLNVTQIHPDDNVWICLADMKKGDELIINGHKVTLMEDIGRGHKVACKPIKKGSNIVKYGFPIGHAEADIDPGEFVHTHNVKTNLKGELEYTFNPTNNQLSATNDKVSPTFMGYRRENGDVGVRNEIWVINTVGCINKVAENLVKMAERSIKVANVDGFSHFAHPYGCSQLGDDLVYTQKILANLIHHPNAGGVLVLGLGCENNYIDLFKNVIGEYNPNRVKFLAVQQVEDEFEEGLQVLEDLAEYAGQCKREEVPVSVLKIGLKCGGSDGLSGITANPLLGVFSDKLISYGGSTVLTEVPEMFGAETILMDRAKDEETFARIVDLINNFKKYFIKYDQPVYENPSPGNKAGGITTLEEKSLGCVQKGGFSPVNDILEYGGRVTEKGLSLLQGPGNDLVSVTGLAASGCQIVLFTTGRGTPFGGPTPTVKVATNTALAEKKKRWIDFNAGQLVEGTTMEELSEQFFQYIIDVASGRKQTNNELYGYKEIAIFKDGVTM
ncbi:UxaA family hydrolase [Schinkia azotoformans]|uniref:UxaA family hydrolase n=1 Tax=Schinkia azotoformans TaxID=1454 RepID=UPI002DBF3083|nr:altronate dehydratase family protein [Schinkia azotoformans]MEC1742114.1 altronate dehydratase family protein [Schinkia azotoformans]MEC1764998.1 altronate dehydratase family protein [Schinkia azotoformans]MEC1785924.1 altronate dehydratase family protein [Schinkia azotoformans]MED4375100.1 altronate dehydratase family protein [Schinkia azotoformans]MED4419747.1 altronate dehydratase family protein [Schinkia azotoformans]